MLFSIPKAPKNRTQAKLADPYEPLLKGHVSGSYGYQEEISRGGAACRVVGVGLLAAEFKIVFDKPWVCEVGRGCVFGEVAYFNFRGLGGLLFEKMRAYFNSSVVSSAAIVATIR